MRYIRRDWFSPGNNPLLCGYFAHGICICAYFSLVSSFIATAENFPVERWKCERRPWTPQHTPGAWYSIAVLLDACCRPALNRQVLSATTSQPAVQIRGFMRIVSPTPVRDGDTTRRQSKNRGVSKVAESQLLPGPLIIYGGKTKKLATCAKNLRQVAHEQRRTGTDAEHTHAHLAGRAKRNLCGQRPYGEYSSACEALMKISKLLPQRRVFRTDHVAYPKHRDAATVAPRDGPPRHPGKPWHRGAPTGSALSPRHGRTCGQHNTKKDKTEREAKRATGSRTKKWQRSIV